jgi:hypothetical protein
MMLMMVSMEKCDLSKHLNNLLVVFLDSNTRTAWVRVQPETGETVTFTIIPRKVGYTTIKVWLDIHKIFLNIFKLLPSFK